MNENEHDRRKTEAEVLRQLLDLGLIKRSNVVEWADGYIVVDEKPSDLLLELSTSSKAPVTTFDRLLMSVPGHYDDDEVTRRIFTFMADRLENDPSIFGRVSKALFSMSRDPSFDNRPTQKHIMYTGDSLHDRDPVRLRTNLVQLLRLLSNDLNVDVGDDWQHYFD